MAIVIPTGYAQVTFNWQHTLSSRGWSTVLGVSHDSAGAADIAETAIDAWTGNLAIVQDSSITFESVTVRMGPNSGATPGITLEVPVNEFGSTNLVGIAANCTLLVRKLTNFGGRANRGRNYWPGFLAESMVGEIGDVDPTIVSNFQTIFVDFFGDMASGNGATTALTPNVILHDEASPATTPSTVTAVQVDSIIGSQRRRIR